MDYACEDIKRSDRDRKGGEERDGKNRNSDRENREWEAGEG